MLEEIEGSRGSVDTHIRDNSRKLTFSLLPAEVYKMAKGIFQVKLYVYVLYLVIALNEVTY